MGVMLLCPGQGTQHPAMFERLVGEPAAREVLDIAAARLGLDLRRLGTAEDGLDYADNRVAQILITAHCLAVRAVLGAEVGDICVGYSVGEIAANACAGALDAAAAFDLIEQRVNCMDEACRAGGRAQGMLAVIGIPLATIGALATEAGLAVAIINGADHVVLGGPVEVLDRFEPTLEARGARNVKRLAVRVASHTPFIADAGPAFAAMLARAPWKPPQIPVLSGIDGRLIGNRDGAVAALSEQLWKPLDFRRCMQLAGERGATCALEIGPGHSLTRLAADLLPEVPVRAFEDFRSPAGPLKWLAAQSRSSSAASRA